MSYHEILMEYWRAGKIEEAIKYFKQWKEEGLLSQESIERFHKLLPDQLEYAFEKNPKYVYIIYHRFYRGIKEERKWDDNKLCENLGISKEDISKIINLEPTSNIIYSKILNEYVNCIEEKESKIVDM